MVWETNPSKKKLTQSETKASKALGRESSKAVNESDQVFHSLKMGLSHWKHHLINITVASPWLRAAETAGADLRRQSSELIAVTLTESFGKGRALDS